MSDQTLTEVPAELFTSGDPSDGLEVWEGEGGYVPPEPPSRVARAFETIGRAHAGIPYHGGYHFIRPR